MGSFHVPTIGVEEELLLVDPRTGEPSMCNEAVAAHARNLGLELQLELTPCQIETATPVVSTAEDILASVDRSRSITARAARMEGAVVVAAGVPPVLPLDGPVTDTKRYRRIASEYGIIAAEQGVCGAHVHVAVPQRDTAVQISNFLRPWLPVLLALTANSALYDGKDTGYSSWRSVLWSRWPSAGPPPFLHSYDHYRQLVGDLSDIGAIIDDGMVYWDVRPSHTFPTLEVRISDVPALTEDAVMLALLVRGLVITATRSLESGQRAPQVAEHHLRWAYWRAARDGLAGCLVDPHTGSLTSARSAVNALLSHVDDALTSSGDRDMVQRAIDRVLRDGNGAARQRRVLAQTGSVVRAVPLLAQR